MVQYVFFGTQSVEVLIRNLNRKQTKPHKYEDFSVSLNALPCKSNTSGTQDAMHGFKQNLTAGFRLLKS